MKQTSHLSKSSLDSSEPPRKKPSSRDYQNDPQSEDPDRLCSNFSKIGSNFDYSNFSLFFKHRVTNSRSSNDSYASRVHIKKKSNETFSSSSRESTLKRLSSKDFSHLEDLYENTTIITTPHETRPHSKKVSNEIPLSAAAKISNEEGVEPWQEYLVPDSYSDRDNMKKKLKGIYFSGASGASKDDKQQEQEIMGTISQLGLNGEGEEHKGEKEKEQMKYISGALKSNFNVELIERIKNKALHKRRTSTSNNSSSNAINTSNSNSIQNIQQQHMQMQMQQDIPHTNNSSVFNNNNSGVRKVAAVKALNVSNTSSQNKKEGFDCNLIESFRNSDSLLFMPFEADLGKSEVKVECQREGKEVLQPLQKAPTSLLTKSIEAQEQMMIKESAGGEKTVGGKKKPNPLDIATDTTIDSDNLTTLNFNYHNNSFSTLFSNSFNNSGKLDFNSPLRVDSGRLTENLHIPANNVANNMVNPQPMPLAHSQRTLFNSGQNLMGLYGGHGSGSNTDRSNSLSWNEEYTTNSNLSSAISTPQGMHQKISFFNQTLNVVSQSANMDRSYVCSSQTIGPQTVKNNSSSSFNLPTQNLNQSMTSLSGAKKQNQGSFVGGKESKPSSSSKSKKKTQEANNNSQYEIDLNKVDHSARTTVMVKNIPNKYDLPLLLEAIERNYKGKYDFLYLPIDPRNRCNVGYAFINFIDPKYVRDFYNEFHAKKWEKFNSEKVCDIKYARIQGKKALIHHFQYSNVMSQQDKRLKPYIPQEFELPNTQKIKDLVNKQKLEIGGDGL